MIQFNKQSGQKILELGGGANRHPQVDLNLDCRKVDGVDLVHDLSTFPFPLPSDDFEAVYSCYCIEHLPFTKTLDFLKECYRVGKGNGKIILILPNTENQIEWIKNNENGWDDEDFFTSASKVLYGGNDYGDNTHRAFFNPSIIIDLLTKAGFSDVTVSPFGARSTDMIVDATKKAVVIPPAEKTVAKHVRPIPVGVPLREVLKGEYRATNENKVAEVVKLSDHIDEVVKKDEVKHEEQKKDDPLKGMKREEIFSREYFQGGSKVGGYAFEGYSDFPCHWTTAKKILERNPKSVVELGSARGHVVKRLEDRGIPCVGLEISRHCYLTRVTNAVQTQDLCAETWGPFPEPKDGKKPFSHALSCAVFEHIPEEYLHVVLSNLRNIADQGLHGIDFGCADNGFDRSHCTLKDYGFWRNKFDEYGLYGHEIVDKESLEDQKYFPHEAIQGTGFKVNLGCGLNQFWHNWINVDMQDLGQFSQSRGHAFFKHDIRNGLGCFATAGVDGFYLGEILPYLDYNQCSALLRECRRCIKPDGELRISVMDADTVTKMYNIDPGSVFGPSLDFDDFDEYSESVAKAKTDAQKLHALLYQGKQSIFDRKTLWELVEGAGFQIVQDRPGTTSDFKYKKEVMDSGFDLNLFATAIPKQI